MSKKDLITIDPSEIQILAQEGEKFIFKPNAEESLKQLLRLQELVNNAVEQVKAQIGEAGKAINPNFKGVIGEEIRCVYRKYGAKYKYDFSKKKVLLPFLKEKVYYSVETEKVDDYLNKVGELPDGITEADREDKLSISYKGGEEDE